MDDLDPIAVFERRKIIINAIASEVAIINDALKKVEAIHEVKAQEVADLDDLLTEMREDIDNLELAEQNLLDTLTHEQRCDIINNGAS